MATTHVGSVWYDVQLRQQQFISSYAQVTQNVTTLRQSAAKPITFKVSGIQGLDAAGRTISGLAGKIIGFMGKLGGRGIGSVAGLLSLVDRMGLGVRRMGDRIIHLGRSISSFSLQMSLLLYPLVKFGIDMAKVGADLETNIVQIGTQLELSGDQLATFLAGVEEEVIAISKVVPVAATDIARAMYFIVSSMTIPEETAQAMLRPLSEAAVAGKSTVEEIAGAVAVIGNVYDHILVTADGVARFVRADMEGAIHLTMATQQQVSAAVRHTTDVLFEAVREGRAEVSDYTQQVGDFLQVAATAGASLEEALAVYTQATRVTTPAVAATWTARFYQRLLTSNFLDTMAEWNIKIEDIVEGTGKWTTAQAGLNAEQQETQKGLEQTITKAGARFNKYIADAVSNWDDYTAALKLYEETGEILPGFNTASLASYYTLINAQQELNELMEAGQRTVQKWTGESKLRPTVDIFTDLAGYILSARSEAEQLQRITEAFPSIRATQAFLLFLKNYQQMAEWTEKWTEATGITEEKFEQMATTVNNRIVVLLNNIAALGKTFFSAYKERILSFIDGIVYLTDKLSMIRPETVQRIVDIVAAVASLAPLSLLMSTILTGLGSFIGLLGSLLSTKVIIGALTFFGLFGDYAKDAWRAIREYDIKTLNDVITFFTDLAVQLGLVKERDVRKILESFGVKLGKMGSPQVMAFLESFKGMWNRLMEIRGDALEFIAIFGDFLAELLGAESNNIWDLWESFVTVAMEGKDAVVSIFNSFGDFLAKLLGAEDSSFFSLWEALLQKILDARPEFLEWVEAFRLLLKDIAERKGVIGTMVGYIEKLAKVILPFLGAKFTGATETPEEKKQFVDVAVGGLIGAWLLGKAVSMVASVVNVAGGVVNFAGGGLLGGLTTVVGLSVIMAAAMAAAEPMLQELREKFLPEWFRLWAQEVKSKELGGGPPPEKDWREVFKRDVIDALNAAGGNFGKGFEDLIAWITGEFEFESGGPGGGGGEGGQVPTTVPEGEDVWRRTPPYLPMITPEQKAIQDEYLRALDLEFITKRGIAGIIKPEDLTEEEKERAAVADLEMRTKQLGEPLSYLERLLDRMVKDREEEGAEEEKRETFLRAQTAVGQERERLLMEENQREAEKQRLLALAYGAFGGGAGPMAPGLRGEEMTDKAREYLRILSGRMASEEELRESHQESSEAMEDLEEDVEATHEPFGKFFQYTTDILTPLEQLQKHTVKLRMAFQDFVDWIKGQTGGGISSQEACEAAGGTWVDGRCIKDGFQHGGVASRDMTARVHKGEIMFNPRYPRADLAAMVGQAMGGLTPAPAYATNIALNPTLQIGSFSGSQSDMMNLREAFRNMTYDASLELERKLRTARRDEDRRRW